MNFLTKVNLNKNIEASDKFCRFDFDPVPQTIEEHLKLSGWVVGIKSIVVSVELVQDGQLVGEAPLTINRPHAAQIYKDFPGAEHSGFVIDLALENIHLESGEILIQAVFEDFQRIPLADLKLSQSSFLRPKKKTFFVHVGKTAGSSFNKFLHTHLHGNSHCEAHLELSQPWTFKNLDLLKSWDFISGHLGIQYFNKNFERDQYFLVTLLRNPFDQIISHVNWLAYIHQSDHNSKFYQSTPDVFKKIGYNLSQKDLTNPLEVIDFLLEYKWLFKNTQSNYFQTDSNNADAIIENLLNFDLVGLTEAYSKFIEKYVSLIGLGDMIEPIVSLENVNSKPALNKKELLKNSKFVDFLNDYNEVDIKVYNYFYNLHKNGLDNLPSEALSIKGASQEKILAVTKTRGTQIVDNNQPPDPIVDSIAKDQLQSIQTNYLKLDLGCGGKKKPGTIGLDYRAVPGVVDHVLNLQKDKFPFPDRSVDYIYSAHCLEHLTESPIHLFKEISRVCVEGSRLELWTPYLWHNSAFIYGHTTYYQEDNYMHLCVLFPDFWSPGLGARWYLKELVYVIEPQILVELYQKKVQLDFAIRYYKGVVHELGAIIEVSHENKGQIIYPQRSFTTNRFAQRFLLQQQSQPLDEIELTQALNWFNGASS